MKNPRRFYFATRHFNPNAHSRSSETQEQPGLLGQRRRLERPWLM